MVDCIGRLFGMYNICHRIQSAQHNCRTEIGRERRIKRTVNAWFWHMKMKTMVRTVNEMQIVCLCT